LCGCCGQYAVLEIEKPKLFGGKRWETKKLEFSLIPRLEDRDNGTYFFFFGGGGGKKGFF